VLAHPESVASKRKNGADTEVTLTDLQRAPRERRTDAAIERLAHRTEKRAADTAAGFERVDAALLTLTHEVSSVTRAMQADHRLLIRHEPRLRKLENPSARRRR
jgi:hypothetical protein